MALPQGLARLVDGYTATRNEIGASGSRVDRLDAPGAPSLFLKQGEGQVADDIADEYVRLRWLQGRLSVPRLVAFAEEANKAWLLSEALPGIAADDWLKANPDCRGAAVANIARFLRQLHALEADACPFNAALPLRLAAARANIDAGRVAESDFDDARASWTAEQVWDHLHALLPIQTEPAVTHGDYALSNILLDAAGAVTGVIDVGRLGIADRYQDLAILWNSLRAVDHALADQMFADYGVEPDRRKIEFHLLLDELF